MKGEIIPERKQQPPFGRRGMSIDEFGRRYGIGRTKTFEEIKTGRLRAKKIGRRTIIAEDDAEVWLRQLPCVGVQVVRPTKAST